MLDIPKELFTYPVFPAGTGLEEKRRLHVVESPRELVEPSWESPVPEALVEERIPKARGVAQQHPQRNPRLLILELAIWQENLDILQLRAESLCLVTVI